VTKLLTVAEAAAELRLSRSAAYDLIARGELRSITIGKSRRITPEDLDQFIERRRRESQDAAV